MALDLELAYRGLVKVRDRHSDVSKFDGTGVLVEGGCILTVAHNFYPNVPNPEDYRTYSTWVFVRLLASEKEVMLLVAHADTCLDSAILGISGAHESLCEEEVAVFEKCIDEMVAQPIRLVDRTDTKRFSVSFYSHKIGWVQGNAIIDQQYPHYLLIDADAPVEDGMSGDPVFTDDGRVIGCLVGSEDRNGRLVFANLCCACLPGWALDAQQRQAAWLSLYSRKFVTIDLNKAKSWHD